MIGFFLAKRATQVDFKANGDCIILKRMMHLHGPQDIVVNDLDSNNLMNDAIPNDFEKLDIVSSNTSGKKIKNMLMNISYVTLNLRYLLHNRE